MHEAIAVLRGSGLSIRLTTLPRQFEDYQRLCGDLTDAEAARALKPFVEKLSGKDARRAEQFREGSHIDDDGLRRLYQQRSEDIKAFRRFSQEIDVILTPTVPISAIPIHEPKVNRPLPPLSRFTRLANYLDLIAISLPIRPTLNYLPVGLQLMCIPEREKALFNLARHAEERLSILSGGNR